MVYDPDANVDADSVYECLDCGTRYEAPGSQSCPDCGRALRNTSYPIE